MIYFGISRVIYERPPLISRACESDTRRLGGINPNDGVASRDALFPGRGASRGLKSSVFPHLIAERWKNDKGKRKSASSDVRD